MSFFTALFGGGKPAPPPEDLLKDWKKKINREKTSIDRDITKAERGIKEALSECKALAKKRQPEAVKMHAKQVRLTAATLLSDKCARLSVAATSQRIRRPVHAHTLTAPLPLHTPSPHRWSWRARRWAVCTTSRRN